MVNAASWRIRQYGGLTPDATRGGFIGRIAISDDASFVRILSPVQPQYGALDPLTWTWEQLDPLFYSMMPGEIEQIVQISPYEIPKMLTSLTGRRDFAFLSRATELDKCDYNKIHGIMSRAFVEDSDQFQVPENCFPLPIYDHNGVFVRMNVYYNGAVFELKSFTHKNLLEPYPFLFRPDRFGICFNTPAALKLPFRRALGGGLIPLFDEIVLDTRIAEVLSGDSPANAILILAAVADASSSASMEPSLLSMPISSGKYAGLDRVLFPGHKTFLLWRPGEPCSRKEFAAALDFVAAAKMHGVTVHIRQHPGSTILGISDLTRQARSFGLSLPNAIKEHRGTLDHDNTEGDGGDSVAETNNTKYEEI